MESSLNVCLACGLVTHSCGLLSAPWLGTIDLKYSGVPCSPNSKQDLLNSAANRAIAIRGTKVTLLVSLKVTCY